MPSDTIDPATLLSPPDEAAVARALAEFSDAVRRHYGERLRGIYLFGSRARGDHQPDSDADVAVVLANDGWDFWAEKMRLVDLAFEPGVSHGLHISPWPFSELVWHGAQQGRYFDVARTAKQDAIRIGTFA